MSTTPTDADDCERVLRLLIDRDSLTLDEIRQSSGHSHHDTNRILCGLPRSGTIVPVTERVRGRKVTKYQLRSA